MAPQPLPIDPFVPDILGSVREVRAAVIVAAPGAGKSTRIPVALAADGPAIVLQPRRVAARSIARRIAAEQGWTLGREVGWHVRFERQFCAATRVLLATEGILTARLHQDPLLGDFRTIVLDEFHERTIHADVGLALARQAFRARDDLRVVVMSATLDTSAVAAFLGGCPVVRVPGAPHPLEIRYTPGRPPASAVSEALECASGQVLCFLPGAPEIRRALPEVSLAAVAVGADVVELHGSLDAGAQDAALAPVPHRRVILATNVAETSLTVPGVTAVVDTGLHKVARYDPARAIDSLEVERIPLDAADQRAGRAARLAPGVAWRLWDRADRLRAQREPEVHRVDLSGPLLDVLAWGGDPLAFEWFDPPVEGRVGAALDLLRWLGAVADGRLTEIGRRMQRLPLHPRLARILLAADGAPDAALACAVSSERGLRRHDGAAPTTTCDLLPVLDRKAPDGHRLPPHITRVAAELERLAGGERRAPAGERGLRRALLAGYPDRVARRRAPGSPRVLLASGHGAVVGPESGVRGGEFLVALDVQSGPRGAASEARISAASLVDPEWLAPTDVRVEHVLGEDGVVRAWSRARYGAMVLADRPATVDEAIAAGMLATAYVERLTPADEQLVRRLRFAGIPMRAAALASRAAAGCRSLREIHLARGLPSDLGRELDRLAPAVLVVPSGRKVPLEYQHDGSVSASVKLQELFGLAETPAIGARRVPVVMNLLAPNGRSVQSTRDLRSFWARTYPEVRRELRGRYPRHPWPEDPWSATPTARAKPRRPRVP